MPWGVAGDAQAGATFAHELVGLIIPSARTHLSATELGALLAPAGSVTLMARVASLHRTAMLAAAASAASTAGTASGTTGNGTGGSAMPGSGAGGHSLAPGG